MKNFINDNSYRRLSLVVHTIAICIMLSSAFLFSCTKESDSLEDGLIFYYPFNGNVKDAAGNGNHGIDYTTGNYVTGKRGKALDFNGTSDYIQLKRTINSEKGLTFSFWMKSRGAYGTENSGVIIGKYSMSTNSKCFLIYSFGPYEARTDNRLAAAFYKEGYSSAIHDNVKSWFEAAELLVYPSSPALWTISNPKRIEIGVWTHCVINVSETDLEVWLNGTLCTTKTREYSSYFDSTNEPVYIGNNLSCGAGSNNHFNGVLDELRIYNRTLTREEIQNLYNEK